MPSRRSFLFAAGAAITGPSAWPRLLVSASPNIGFVDVLGAPDENGVRLPSGFSSRVLARSGDVVAGTDFVWHDAPDGGGVIDSSGGGWWYVSNAEVSAGGGGVTALEFDAEGAVIGARSILAGTSRNCAGGVTPWGTWLSCEEVSLGEVYECDPVEPARSSVRPALGAFHHEAAVVDAVDGSVYLTEDRPDGRMYRFVPDAAADLTSGSLSALAIGRASSSVGVGETVAVSWVPTSTAEPDRSSATTGFDGGEGAWMDGDRLLFTTKGDRRVWALDVRTDRLMLLHDCGVDPSTPLDAVDNIVVHQGTGDVYIAEDGGDMQLCVLRERPDGVAIEAFLQVIGQDGSEITGPAFSPDGRRLYFSSQRGSDGRGITYEVTGPFPRPALGPVPSVGLAPARRLDV